jgi:homoserine O-acetyltransferase/O-succinyltransferase
MSLKIFHYNSEFNLESGKSLPVLEIAYHTYGNFIPGKSKVVWVCHALTASSDVFDWWKGLFGETDLFNPEDYFIVCPNILGSYYGTTGAASIDPETGKPSFLNFPLITVRDMVKAHQILANYLGIENIHTIIGGSLGGQQAIEWSIIEPERIEHLIAIATNAQASPWGIAFRESQRMALEADSTFRTESLNAGQKGMKAARAVALLSYRNYDSYRQSQGEETNEKINDFRASSYQNYQGDKLVKRFNAHVYWYLSKAMDTQNVGRGRKNIIDALASIKAKTLSVGITSDILFPPHEQEFLAEHIPGAVFREIDSLYGHDGFLLETKQLTNTIREFYKLQTVTSSVVEKLKQ